jgi:hypothetical protein
MGWNGMEWDGRVGGLTRKFCLFGFGNSLLSFFFCWWIFICSSSLSHLLSIAYPSARERGEGRGGRQGLTPQEKR